MERRRSSAVLAGVAVGWLAGSGTTRGDVFNISLDAASVPAEYHIDAGSNGRERVDLLQQSSGGPAFYFSVDRVAVGLPGTVIRQQAAPPNESAHGDIYAAGFNTHSLYREEVALGLDPGFFGDDIDALQIEPGMGGPDVVNVNAAFAYSSLWRHSTLIGQPAVINGLAPMNDMDGLTPDDIVLSLGPTNLLFASGVTQIGLMDNDDLDALMLLDVTPDGMGGYIDVPNGMVDPGLDLAIFSLDPFSPSTSTGGLGGTRSPADLLSTDFTGNYGVFRTAAQIGLLTDDNVDALSMAAVPEPGMGLWVAVFGVLLVWRRRTGRDSRTFGCEQGFSHQRPQGDSRPRANPAPADSHQEHGRKRPRPCHPAGCERGFSHQRASGGEKRSSRQRFEISDLRFEVRHLRAAPDLATRVRMAVIAAFVGCASGALARPGDFDGDGDVDLSDVAGFQNGFSGEGGGVAGGDELMDYDSDADVDLLDYAGLREEMGGPAAIGNPCAALPGAEVWGGYSPPVAGSAAGLEFRYGTGPDVICFRLTATHPAPGINVPLAIMMPEQSADQAVVVMGGGGTPTRLVFSHLFTVPAGGAGAGSNIYIDGDLLLSPYNRGVLDVKIVAANGGVSVVRYLIRPLLDLDVDSDNNSNDVDRAPQRDANEDSIEDDDDKPGVVLCVNDDDDDGDGIADYGDGYNLDAIDGNDDDENDDEDDFVKMVLSIGGHIDTSLATLRVTYSASDPALATVAGMPPVVTPAPGRLRIWAKAGTVARKPARINAATPGDYVAPGIYDASDFNFMPDAASGQQAVCVWLEGIRPKTTAGADRIEFAIDPDGPGPQDFVGKDAVRASSVKVDIDIQCSVDAVENTDGAFVSRNIATVNTGNFDQIKFNMRPITITASPAGGTAVLSATTAGVVELFKTDGTAVPLPATITPLPATLLINGTEFGTTDLKIEYTLPGGRACGDQVKVRVNCIPGLASESLAAFPFAEYVRTANDGGILQVSLDPKRHKERVGMSYAVYIVQHKTAAQYAADNSLTDVTGVVEEFDVLAAGINANTQIVWNAISGSGLYDIVLDFGNCPSDPNNFVADGDLDPGDIIGLLSASASDAELNVLRDPGGDPAMAPAMPPQSTVYSQGTIDIPAGFDDVGMAFAGVRLTGRFVRPNPLMAGTPLVAIAHGNHNPWPTPTASAPTIPIGRDGTASAVTVSADAVTEMWTLTLQGTGRWAISGSVSGAQGQSGLLVGGMWMVASNNGFVTLTITQGATMPFVAGDLITFTVTRSTGDPSGPNFDGYLYWQTHLANHGVASISIDLDRLVDVFPGIRHRGWVLLKNIEAVLAANTNLDAGNFVLMGHSRGGEAVLQAYRMLANGAERPAGSTLAGIAAAGIRGIISVSPVTFENFTFKSAEGLGAPFLLRYGGADGDVDGISFSGAVPTTPMLPIGRDGSTSAVSTSIFNGTQETWTLTLQVNGRWAISGSFSGAQGQSSAAAGGVWTVVSTNQFIRLTITDGATMPFLAGDQITFTVGVRDVRPFQVYDRAIGTKQVIFIEGANHNFFNTSWACDDARQQFFSGGTCINVSPMGMGDNLVAAADARSALKAYATAFVFKHAQNKAGYDDFFKRYQNRFRPLSVPSGLEILGQYKDSTIVNPNFVVDDYEAQAATTTSSSGNTVNLTTTINPFMGVDEPLLRDPDPFFDYAGPASVIGPFGAVMGGVRLGTLEWFFSLDSSGNLPAGRNGAAAFQVRQNPAGMRAVPETWTMTLNGGNNRWDGMGTDSGAQGNSSAYTAPTASMPAVPAGRDGTTSAVTVAAGTGGEDWTLTLLGTGRWRMAGSVSGLQGQSTALAGGMWTATSTNGFISLTINQGPTMPFVAGDVITFTVDAGLWIYTATNGRMRCAIINGSGASQFAAGDVITFTFRGVNLDEGQSVNRFTQETKGVIVSWPAAQRRYEYELPAAQRDLSTTRFVSLRVAKTTPDPSTRGAAIELTATLVDEDGNTSSMRTNTFSTIPGGYVSRYRRDVTQIMGTGLVVFDLDRWTTTAVFRTFRFDVCAFTNDAKAIDLRHVRYVRLEMGGATGTNDGFMAIDDAEITVR